MATRYLKKASKTPETAPPTPQKGVTEPPAPPAAGREDRESA